LILCHNIFSSRDDEVAGIAVAVAVVVTVEGITIPVKVLKNMENF